MDNKNAPKEDEVLLKELTSWVEAYKDAAERNALAESPTESAKYLISKAREAVEGAKVPDCKYLGDNLSTYSRGQEMMSQAILKALGGK